MEDAEHLIDLFGRSAQVTAEVEDDAVHEHDVAEQPLVSAPSSEVAAVRRDLLRFLSRHAETKAETEQSPTRVSREAGRRFVELWIQAFVRVSGRIPPTSPLSIRGCRSPT